MTNCAPGGAYNFVMDIIYIDRLFLLNLVLDYLIVLCSARLCGIKLRRARYAAAAVFGALYAVLSLLPGLAFFKLWPVKLICGLLMALIAFGGEDKLWRCCLTFLPFPHYSAELSGQYRCKTAETSAREHTYLFRFRCLFCRLRLSTPF